MSKTRTDEIIEQAEAAIRALRRLYGDSIQKASRESEVQRLNSEIDRLDRRLRRVEQPMATHTGPHTIQ